MYKCYGQTAHTATIYSVEVGYYKFGTCEQKSDGAYYCGDHSCNSFLHAIDKPGRSKTVMEQMPGQVDHMIEQQNSQYFFHEAPATYECHKNKHLALSGENALYHDPHNRVYNKNHHYTVSSLALPPSLKTYFHSATLNTIGQAGLLIDMMHQHTTMSVGKCKSTCDKSIDCVAYEVDKHESKCLLYRSERLIDQTILSNPIQEDLADKVGELFCVKRTQEKTTSRRFGNFASQSAGNGYHRRLAGVY